MVFINFCSRGLSLTLVSVGASSFQLELSCLDPQPFHLHLHLLLFLALLLLWQEYIQQEMLKRYLSDFLGKLCLFAIAVMMPKLLLTS